MVGMVINDQIKYFGHLREYLGHRMSYDAWAGAAKLQVSLLSPSWRTKATRAGPQGVIARQSETVST